MENINLKSTQEYISCISNGKITLFRNGKKYFRHIRPHMSGFSSVAGLTDILPRDIKARENLLWRGNPNWELSYYITQCCCFRLNNWSEHPTKTFLWNFYPIWLMMEVYRGHKYQFIARRIWRGRHWPTCWQKQDINVAISERVATIITSDLAH